MEAVRAALAEKRAMPNAISDDASRTICDHMNEDHAESILDYVRAFAHVPAATAARMLAIDSDGMDVEATTGDATVTTRIAFDHPLADATDARDTLIAMARTASAFPAERGSS